LEQLGGPKIDNGELHFGKTAVSDDAVDAVMKKQAGVATVLTKTGETYVGAATTVKKMMVPAPSAPHWTQAVPLLPSSTRAKPITATRQFSERLTTLVTSQSKTQQAR
jgi:hypothetical protein